MSCPSNVCLFCCCCCFGPAQLPQTGRASMSVVEVDDPQLIILLHFMTPFMAIQPVFESPLARPASLQGSMASQLLIDLLRDRPGAHGMLLVSIEQDGKLQFLVSLSLSQLRFPLLISAASSYVVAESISYSLLPFSLPLFLAKRDREGEREKDGSSLVLHPAESSVRRRSLHGRPSRVPIVSYSRHAGEPFAPY